MERGDYKIRVIRILFFLNNVSKARHFDSVVQMLAERGHTVVLAAARQHNRPLALPKNLSLTNRSLIARRLPGRVEVTACPVRRVDWWQQVAPAMRGARDYVRFLDPRYAHASKLESRSATHAPRGWLRFIRDHPRLSRHWRALARALALAEDAIPSERLFDLFIAYERPDLVLVTPLVDYGSYQTDYVKSAHRMGVPVVFAPFSWDNLTNRGLIRVAPDRMLVWNEIQKKEAIELHGVPADRLVVTGAPRFDAFFAMRPSTSRKDFCKRIGLDPAARFVLYLCSSEFVAPREVEFVIRWMSYLRQSSDPAVRTSGVVVRPHPAHLKQWKNADLSGFSNAALWDEKEVMNADQSLYDSIHHSNAVVGLNTSAMIEAGILDKAVLTLVMDEFAGGQEETLHFHYLRAANGGLLHEAHGFEEHAQHLGAALRGGAGSDGAGDQVRRFVERFVRPRGLQTPVTPIMVEEIERAARISKRPRGAAPVALRGQRRHAGGFHAPRRRSGQAKGSALMPGAGRSSEPRREAASFRDPAGFVFHQDGRVRRAVTEYGIEAARAVRATGLIGRLVAAGSLLPEEEIATSLQGQPHVRLVLEHPRIPFVSYPYEWPFRALQAAALLHLDIQIEALEAGVMLTDASAYNVQFIGARPVFIDHLAFRPYRDGELWAAHRQFCEQFLHPLLLQRLLGVEFQPWYRGRLEGIPGDEIARLLRWRHKLGWNVFTNVVLPARLQYLARRPGVERRISRAALPREALRQMFSSLRRWIARMTPRGVDATTWAAYDAAVPEAESRAIGAFVEEFVRRRSPARVWDLGCNAGRYCEVALGAGAGYAVGIDSDPGALDRAFTRARDRQLPLLPLLLDIVNPSPSQGWRGQERSSLDARGRPDAVLAIAVIHHIAIARNVPLDEIVALLTTLAPEGVIGFVPHTDRRARALFKGREDIFRAYTLEHFLSLLQARARIVRQEQVPDAGGLGGSAAGGLDGSVAGGLQASGGRVLIEFSTR